MTSPFAMYHFDRVSTYGVVANLIAVPLTGFWVMPMGMAALLLMPFGLDAPFWYLAARGCDGILWIAHMVSAWPYAVLVTPAMPIAALVAIALGLVGLCLLRSRARGPVVVPRPRHRWPDGGHRGLFSRASWPAGSLDAYGGLNSSRSPVRGGAVYRYGSTSA